MLFSSSQNLSGRLPENIAAHEETIYALSSAPGKAGVAVVRISGFKAHLALKALLKDGKLPKSRIATLRTLYNPTTQAALDQSLVLTFGQPASFTGEDVVELHVHGGLAVVNGVLNTLAALPGLRHATPGEFTKRAFMNQKLDLTQVEGLADLINAETEAQRIQAIRHLDGEAGAMYERWRENLLHCLAHIEAYIDFAEDEGIESDTMVQAVADVEKLRDSIARHLDDNKCGERLKNGVQVGIVGYPDVGKSSLLNYLCKRSVSIVAAGAGTTRDVIETSLDMGGYPVIIRDTAGLRDGAEVGEVEKEGIRRAQHVARQSDFCICVQDTTRLLCEKAPGGTATCVCGGIPGLDTVLVLNKIDLLEPKARMELLHRVLTYQGPQKPLEKSARESNLVHSNQQESSSLMPSYSTCNSEFQISCVSCNTGTGLDELQHLLFARVKSFCTSSSYEGPAIMHARHRSHLQSCKNSLDEALNWKKDEVKLAEELRRAASQLGLITGKVGAEEILDRLFQDFCIGK